MKTTIFWLKTYIDLKEYSAQKLLNEFQVKSWKERSLHVLLRKFKDTGSVDRRPGNGRRTDKNVGLLVTSCLLRKCAPQIYQSVWEFPRNIKSCRSSKGRFIFRATLPKENNVPINRLLMYSPFSGSAYIIQRNYKVRREVLFRFLS